MREAAVCPSPARGARLRPAGLADAAALARVQLTCWVESYRGIVPDSWLARQSLAAQGELWSQRIAAPALGTDLFVAVEAGGESLLGFGISGPERGLIPAYGGEIHTIYLLRRAQGQGLGARLMAAMATALRRHGFRDATVWTLAANDRARGFYQRLGGRLYARHELLFDDVPLPELCYVWDGLEGLAGAGTRPSRAAGRPAGRPTAPPPTLLERLFGRGRPT